jgi:DNA-binding PadR family transcriptional regulator
MESSLALLGLLCPQPSYGYDLKLTWDRFFGARRPMAFGQVYSTLARLIRDGYIVALGEEAGDGPDRKRYAVTGEGRERIAQWMFTPDPPNDHLRSNLFAKTIIALLIEDDAERLLDLQRAEHMSRMREFTSLKREAGIAQVLIYDYAIFHIEADLRWIDLTSARLLELRKDVVQR